MKRVKYVGGGAISEVGRHQIGPDGTFVCDDEEAEVLVEEQPANFAIVGDVEEDEDDFEDEEDEEDEEED